MRRRGAGTFVAEPKVAKGMTITSFSDDMRGRGLDAGQPHARALARCRPARGSAASSTSRRPSRSSRVKRLRLADGEPMAIELLHVRESLVPGPDVRATSRRTRSTTCSRSRYGIEIVGGTQTVEPTVTDEEESEVARRAAPLAGAPLRADHARPRAARSSSSRTRSTAATATGSSRSSASRRASAAADRRRDRVPLTTGQDQHRARSGIVSAECAARSDDAVFDWY